VTGVALVVRPESTADHEAIRHVNRLAFGQDAEARLVDALRDGGYVRVSLVAERARQIVPMPTISLPTPVSGHRHILAYQPALGYNS
jgi:hypothetical protein